MNNKKKDIISNILNTICLCYLELIDLKRVQKSDLESIGFNIEQVKSELSKIVDDLNSESIPDCKLSDCFDRVSTIFNELLSVKIQ